MWLRKFLGTAQIYERPDWSYIFVQASATAIISIISIMSIIASQGAIFRNPILLLLIGGLEFFIAWRLIRSLAQKSYVDKLFKQRRWLPQSSQLPSTSTTSKIKASVISSEFDPETDPGVSRININISPIDEMIIGGRLESTVGPANRQLIYNIYDTIMDVWYKHKGSEHKARRTYYTVFEAKLPQKTPHLVFDSHQAKGKQFKSIYIKSQKIPLDSHLNDFFDVYSPQYHQIEVLSFITPEVIEAMLNLKDCDIEFIDDSFFCYAPLLGAQEIVDFRKRCLVLQAKVQDNLHLYKKKPDKIAPLGRRLLKNPWRHLPTAILSSCIVYSAFVYQALKEGRDINVGIFFTPTSYYMFSAAMIFLGLGMWGMISIWRKNKRIEASFLNKKPEKTSSS